MAAPIHFILHDSVSNRTVTYEGDVQIINILRNTAATPSPSRNASTSSGAVGYDHTGAMLFVGAIILLYVGSVILVAINMTRRKMEESRQLHMEVAQFMEGASREEKRRDVMKLQLKWPGILQKMVRKPDTKLSQMLMCDGSGSAESDLYMSAGYRSGDDSDSAEVDIPAAKASRYTVEPAIPGPSHMGTIEELDTDEENHIYI